MGFMKPSDNNELNLVFRSLDEGNFADFKLLHQVIFPVKYSDRFFKDCKTSRNATLLAYDGQRLAGAVACRLETQLNGVAQLYIMTLGVYAAYRDQKIGSRLLDRVLRSMKEEHDVQSAYLHVQVNNSDAIKFYCKQGFAVSGTLQNYYHPQVNPRDAVVLQKHL